MKRIMITPYYEITQSDLLWPPDLILIMLHITKTRKQKEIPFPKREGDFNFKPVMTCATTTMSICIAHGNLSAVMNHYDTHNDLCSTIMDT